jgi:hypothetical protein
LPQGIARSLTLTTQDLQTAMTDNQELKLVLSMVNVDDLDRAVASSKSFQQEETLNRLSAQFEQCQQCTRTSSGRTTHRETFSHDKQHYALSCKDDDTFELERLIITDDEMDDDDLLGMNQIKPSARRTTIVHAM